MILPNNFLFIISLQKRRISSHSFYQSTSHSYTLALQTSYGIIYSSTSLTLIPHPPSSFCPSFLPSILSSFLSFVYFTYLLTCSSVVFLFLPPCTQRGHVPLHHPPLPYYYATPPPASRPLTPLI